MLYMVIERFRDLGLVHQRFTRSGRMLPDGLTYHASWMNQPGTLCYQVMEAAGPEPLDLWIGRWRDLVDFEVVPVLSSAEFWAGYQGE